MKVLIPFYSMYGHIYRMAEAIAAGVKEVAGAEPILRRVPETLSSNILSAMGAGDAQKAFAQIPVCTVDDLAKADAIIFGTPTRFGNMCGQMRQFLDATVRSRDQFLLLTLAECFQRTAQARAIMRSIACFH